MSNKDKGERAAWRSSITLKAIAKVVLHTCKHAHANANGVLVGTTNGGSVQVADAIPLLHEHLNLLPMFEVAMMLVDAHCEKNGLEVVGYYQANAFKGHTDMDHTAKQVATKIAQHCKGAIAIIVNTPALSEQDYSAAAIFNTFKLEDSWVAATPPSHPDITEAMCSSLTRALFAGDAIQVVDFSDHVLSPAALWLDQPCAVWA